jgi:hypothetical protein
MNKAYCPADLMAGYGKTGRLQKRKRKHSLREIMNTLFHMIKTGCQWRLSCSLKPHNRELKLRITKTRRIVLSKDAYRFVKRCVPFCQKMRTVFMGSKAGCKCISKIIEAVPVPFSEIRQYCFYPFYFA